jgi:hypothetical protein
LHQSHTGLFKSHDMPWLRKKMTTARMDMQFAAMTCVQDLQHFKHGVSLAEQWMGNKTKKMAKVFLPVVAEDPRINKDLVKIVCVLLDFLYTAQAARLMEREVADLDDVLATIHRLKQVLVCTEIYARHFRLDRIPKFHMVSHYTNSIRKLGTLDNYSTRALEYLHIVYVKQGWDMSNKRNAIPQIIEFCQHLEALKIHRAYLDNYYGECKRTRLAPKVVALVDDDYMGFVGEGDLVGHHSEGALGDQPGKGEEEEWEDIEEDKDKEDEEEGDRRRRGYSASEVEYPQPELALPLQPTRWVMCQGLIDKYSTTNLLQALTTFLGPRAHSKRLFFVPSDEFDIWHKLTLYHLPHSFAPNKPLHHDVIHVRLPLHDNLGRLRREGVFDTTLFVDNPDGFRLHCVSLLFLFYLTHPYSLRLPVHSLSCANVLSLAGYRASRVRAIFRLRPQLQRIYSNKLVYIELFMLFNNALSSVHQLHTTSHNQFEGQCQAVVIPLADIAMACHLTPRFRHLDPDTRLDCRVDLLANAHRFFFNHYYNHFMFLLMQYWRHLTLVAE